MTTYLTLTITIEALNEKKRGKRGIGFSQYLIFLQEYLENFRQVSDV
jgi:hypothetical protein